MVSSNNELSINYDLRRQIIELQMLPIYKLAAKSLKTFLKENCIKKQSVFKKRGLWSTHWTSQRTTLLSVVHCEISFNLFQIAREDVHNIIIIDFEYIIPPRRRRASSSGEYRNTH